ncbi:MAG: hypothetical protein UMR38_06800 [Candidatus Izemoplasma sp.]|nr:hypothetical protein [Candidatus Izemoplasma sp.]
MKKLVVLFLTVLGIVTLSGCSNLDTNTLQTSAMSGTESFAVLSYVSGSLLDTSASDTTVTNQYAFLNNHQGPEIGDEIDDINVYIDRLKVFIEQGSEGFGSATLDVSDRPEYAFLMTFTIEEEVYNLYYNVSDLGEISGILVIGEIEYTIEVLDHRYGMSDEFIPEIARENRENADDDTNTEDEVTSQDAGNTEDDANQDTNTEEGDIVTENDDETEAEDPKNDDDVEENETKMTILASHGANTIKVHYKQETEEDEEKTVIDIEKQIDGVLSESRLVIKQEENEYKVTIEEEGNTYQFKAEEEDGETVYKLDYRVDGVSGHVKIKATIDENGELVYDYIITEGGHQYREERGRPESAGRPDEDTEEETQEDPVEDETQQEDNTTTDGQSA